MREYRTVLVDGIKHTVLISDEQEALLAAQAAGRAVLGLWDPRMLHGEFLFWRKRKCLLIRIFWSGRCAGKKAFPG